MPKTTVLGIRLTEQERAAVNLAAEMARMTPAAWAKDRLLRHPDANPLPPIITTSPPTTANPGGETVIDVDLNQPPCDEDAAEVVPIGKRPHAGPKAKKAALPKKAAKRARVTDPRSLESPAASDCKHPIGRRIGNTCVVCGATAGGKR